MPLEAAQAMVSIHFSALEHWEFHGDSMDKWLMMIHGDFYGMFMVVNGDFIFDWWLIGWHVTDIFGNNLIFNEFNDMFGTAIEVPR